MVNILNSIYIEFSINFDNLPLLNFWLDKQSKILKYFLTVCENVRDNTLTTSQQNNIISNILFPFHFLYTLFENHKKNEKVTNLLMSQIEDIVIFTIYLLDQMNNKFGGFQNYQELKANKFTALTVSPQIPLSNLFTYEIFNNYLFNNHNERIFPFSLYDSSKVFFLFFY